MAAAIDRLTAALTGREAAVITPLLAELQSELADPNSPLIQLSNAVQQHQHQQQQQQPASKLIVDATASSIVTTYHELWFVRAVAVVQSALPIVGPCETAIETLRLILRLHQNWRVLANSMLVTLPATSPTNSVAAPTSAAAAVAAPSVPAFGLTVAQLLGLTKLGCPLLTAAFATDSKTLSTGPLREAQVSLVCMQVLVDVCAAADLKPAPTTTSPALTIANRIYLFLPLLNAGPQLSSAAIRITLRTIAQLPEQINSLRVMPQSGQRQELVLMLSTLRESTTSIVTNLLSLIDPTLTWLAARPSTSPSPAATRASPSVGGWRDYFPAAQLAMEALIELADQLTATYLQLTPIGADQTPPFLKKCVSDWATTLMGCWGKMWPAIVKSLAAVSPLWTSSTSAAWGLVCSRLWRLVDEIANRVTQSLASKAPLERFAELYKIARFVLVQLNSCAKLNPSAFISADQTVAIASDQKSASPVAGGTNLLACACRLFEVSAIPLTQTDSDALTAQRECWGLYEKLVLDCFRSILTTTIAVPLPTAPSATPTAQRKLFADQLAAQTYDIAHPASSSDTATTSAASRNDSHDVAVLSFWVRVLTNAGSFPASVHSTLIDVVFPLVIRLVQLPRCTAQLTRSLASAPRSVGGPTFDDVLNAYCDCYVALTAGADATVRSSIVDRVQSFLWRCVADQCEARLDTCIVQQMVISVWTIVLSLESDNSLEQHVVNTAIQLLRDSGSSATAITKSAQCVAMLIGSLFPALSPDTRWVIIQHFDLSASFGAAAGSNSLPIVVQFALATAIPIASISSTPNSKANDITAAATEEAPQWWVHCNKTVFLPLQLAMTQFTRADDPNSAEQLIALCNGIRCAAALLKPAGQALSPALSAEFGVAISSWLNSPRAGAECRFTASSGDSKVRSANLSSPVVGALLELATALLPRLRWTDLRSIFRAIQVWSEVHDTSSVRTSVPTVWRIAYPDVCRLLGRCHVITPRPADSTEAESALSCRELVPALFRRVLLGVDVPTPALGVEPFIPSRIAVSSLMEFSSFSTWNIKECIPPAFFSHVQSAIRSQAMNAPAPTEEHIISDCAELTRIRAPLPAATATAAAAALAHARPTGVSPDLVLQTAQTALDSVLRSTELPITAALTGDLHELRRLCLAVVQRVDQLTSPAAT